MTKVEKRARAREMAEARREARKMAKVKEYRRYHASIESLSPEEQVAELELFQRRINEAQDNFEMLKITARLLSCVFDYKKVQPAENYFKDLGFDGVNQNKLACLKIISEKLEKLNKGENDDKRIIGQVATCS